MSKTINTGNELRKAMIDSDVANYDELSELSGVSLSRIQRVMSNKPSVKLIDIVDIAKALGLKLKFIALGED